MVAPMHPEEGSYPRRYRDLVRAQNLLEQRDACLPLKILVTQPFQELEHLPPMPVEGSGRGAFVTEVGYEKPNARVGHWGGQCGRGRTVRGPEQGTSNPPGLDGLLRENRGQYGRARGPCQPILCRLRQSLWSL